jgi:hypothetical protein
MSQSSIFWIPWGLWFIQKHKRTPIYMVDSSTFDTVWVDVLAKHATSTRGCGLRVILQILVLSGTFYVCVTG